MATPPDDNKDTLDQAKGWLTRTHTLTLPGWVLAAAAGAALVLLLIALD